MRRQSLWVEIGLTLALLTILVSVLDIGVFYLATRFVLDGASADLSERGATMVAAELAGTPRANWNVVVDRYRKLGMGSVTIYTPTGAVELGEAVEAPRAAREAVAMRQTATGEDERGVYAVAPIGSAQPLGAVRLALPRTTLDLPSWAVVGTHAVLTGVLIGVFGLVLFRRSVVQPIERLRAATQRIAGGEFGIQVADEGSREMEELVTALNTMSAALAAYRERTAEQVHNLEAANAELQRAQDALVRSEKLASVGRLAAGLAHELGNPLAAVRGYVELLGEEKVQPVAAQAWVERAQREVERMHFLLRGLLDYARLDPRVRGEVRVAELMAEALRTVEPQAGFRGVEVVIETKGDPVAWGESALLHQVLVNLLLNAADAGAKHIRMRAMPGVRIEVEDDGEGIRAEDLPRLFEPFFTTRPPGKGTGLGLATAHRILEQHQGAIEVRSQRGTGTTFVVSLPEPLGG